MRKTSCLLLLPLLGLPLRQSVRPSAGPVDWLAGCWENRDGDRLIEERWMPARGGVMLELGRTSRGDSLIDYEFVILRLTGEKPAYEAHPAGQPVETFPAKVVSDTSVIFENLAHDFPQRVGYDRRGSDSLLGWIEGDVGGRTRRVEFPYQRVKCE
jgi:hypothetical protein